MPSDLPSVLPPSATLDKTLYGDLIVALEYDLAFPPHAPFEYDNVPESNQSDVLDLELELEGLRGPSHPERIRWGGREEGSPGRLDRGDHELSPGEVG
jgi:hypothetical protein